MSKREDQMRLLLEDCRLWLGQSLSFMQELQQEGNSRVTDYSILCTQKVIDKFDKKIREIDKPQTAYVGR